MRVLCEGSGEVCIELWVFVLLYCKLPFAQWEAEGDTSVRLSHSVSFCVVSFTHGPQDGALGAF